MNKKYELTDEAVKINNHTLYRIKSLKDFSDVRKGDLGGFIEECDNLTHKDNAWVWGNACIFENAIVSGSSRVYGEAQVYGNAQVYQGAWVFGNAQIFGNARIFGNAEVYGTTWVYGYAWVRKNIKLEFGVWNKKQYINDHYYLISTTLRRVLL